jgi:2-amino-4-hydroxy-6-hydroxymethyldihydropteridine diphosphokinase
MHGEAVAYIGMGSNLGNPRRQIECALGRIRRAEGLRLLAVSPCYRSRALEPPEGVPESQPDYINAVIAVATRLPPHWLLGRLQAIEKAQGRVRRHRWGPRTLDLDILLYAKRRLASPRLSLPHPELHKRAFVLYPLADIAPRLQIPGRGPLIRWLKQCDGTAVRRVP